MKINNSSIKKSINYLKNNECIGIPTETVYGLAANAYSSSAVSKVFKLKKRPKKNPLIVHYYSKSQLERDCHLSKNFYKLYKKFCPGPLTFVLRLKSNKHPVIRSLLNKIDFPLAAPSANISSSISPVTKNDVIDEFGKKIKYVLNGGRSNIGLESTIIDLTNKPKIIRRGGLKLEYLKKILNVRLNYNSDTKRDYPGQRRLHYSPGIPIRLNIKDPKKNSAYILINKKKFTSRNFFYLTKNKNLEEAGKNLYKTLRKIKKRKFKLIEVEKIPNIGIGRTINDRLQRASIK